MAKTSTNKKLAVLKTKENDASVEGFLQTITDVDKRKDATAILSMMKKLTGEKPKMWGASIIGFGNYIYESPKTGRSGEWFLTGFSPRKQTLTIYFMLGFAAYNDLLKKLGKFKISGGSCLYINKLADVDTKILKELIERSYKTIKEKHSKK